MIRLYDLEEQIMEKSKSLYSVVYARTTATRDRHGFTLIELLVVISIIALLMAILIPALNRAREQGKSDVCLYNLKGLVWPG